MKLVVSYYIDRDLMIYGVEADSVEQFTEDFEKAFYVWAEYHTVCEKLRKDLWVESRALGINKFEVLANDKWQEFLASENFKKAMFIQVGDYEFPAEGSDLYVDYVAPYKLRRIPEIATLEQWFNDSKPLKDRK